MTQVPSDANQARTGCVPRAGDDLVPVESLAFAGYSDILWWVNVAMSDRK